MRIHATQSIKKFSMASFINSLAAINHKFNKQMRLVVITEHCKRLRSRTKKKNPQREI